MHMKSKAKNIWLISIVILGLTGAFIGGTFFGIKFAYNLYHPSLSAEYYVKARWMQIALEKLDSNEIKKGHNLIALQVNSDIRTLDLLITEETDEEMRNKIKKLLHSIALHREKFPKYYDIDESFLPETSKNMPIINEILEKYKKS